MCESDAPVGGARAGCTCAARCPPSAFTHASRHGELPRLPPSLGHSSSPMALLMRCWVGCERRPASRPGHVSGEEWELSDLLRRKLWGKGIASRAACLLLHTAAQHDEDQDEDQPEIGRASCRERM